MEGQVSAEQRRPIESRPWVKHLISIWRDVILFFLIDLLSGFLIAAIVYVLMKVILWLGEPWNMIAARYVNKTITVFCVVYVLALAVVAGWHHFQNITHRDKHVPEGTSMNIDQESHDISGEAK